MSVIFYQSFQNSLNDSIGGLVPVNSGSTSFVAGPNVTDFAVSQVAGPTYGMSFGIPPFDTNTNINALRFDIQGWFKNTLADPGNQLLFGLYGTSGNSNGIFIAMNNVGGGNFGAIQAAVKNSAGNLYFITSSNNWNDGAYHYLQMNCNGTTLNLYVGNTPYTMTLQGTLPVTGGLVTGKSLGTLGDASSNTIHAWTGQVAYLQLQDSPQPNPSLPVNSNQELFQGFAI